MDAEQWTTYKATHEKSYGKEEDAERFKIWKTNQAFVKAHNEKFEKGESSYQLAEDHMSDLRPEEYQRTLGCKPPMDP